MNCPGMQSIKACAAYESDKAVRTRIFNQDVEWQIGLEKMKVATDASTWVNDWTADPESDLAFLYKQIALNYNDEAAIGRIVKTIFENKLRNVAEHIVGGGL